MSSIHRYRTPSSETLAQELHWHPDQLAVRDMFDRVAPRYDMVNRVLSFGIEAKWRRAALREIVRVQPNSVLDLACGTGVMTEKLLHQGVPRVYAVDPSSGMLARAQAKEWAQASAQKVSFHQGYAESIPLPNGAVETVLIAFGARNFNDFDASLHEIARVLVPGGRIVVLEFSQPPSRLVDRLYGLYFRRVLPWVGGILSGQRAAYAYLPHSVKEFPSRTQLLDRFAKIGFTDLRYQPLTLGIATLYVGRRWQ